MRILINLFIFLFVTIAIAGKPKIHQITVPSGFQYDLVTTNVLVADEDGNEVCTLHTEYSLDGGISWNVASMQDSIVTANLENESICWASKKDLHLRDCRGVLLKLSVRDESGEESVVDTISPAFNISNLSLYTLSFKYPIVNCSINDSNKKVGGEITGVCEISGSGDLEGYQSKLYYSVDNGGSWKLGNATIIKDSTSNKYTFKWSSSLDLPVFDGNGVKVKIIPIDTVNNKSGVGVPSIPFHLDNKAADYFWASALGGTKRVIYKFPEKIVNLDDSEKFIMNYGNSVSSISETTTNSTLDKTVKIMGDSTFTITASVPDYKVTKYWRIDTKVIGCHLWKKNIHPDGDTLRIFNSDGELEYYEDMWGHNKELIFSKPTDYVKFQFNGRSFPNGECVRVKYFIVQGMSHFTTEQSSSLLSGTNRSISILGGKDSCNNVSDTISYSFYPRDDFNIPFLDFDTLDTALSKNANIGYYIDDLDSNTFALEGIEYQLPSENKWYPATITEDLTTITSSLYDSSFTWETSIDFPSQQIHGVKLRAWPKDTMRGAFGLIENITIDNNEPPSVTLTLLESTDDTTVNFTFEVCDNEKDNVRLNFEFSNDLMNFIPASIVNNNGILEVDSNTYVDTLSWNFKKDINEPLIQGKLFLRCKSSDYDGGGYSTVIVNVNTFGLGSVSLSEFVDEQSDTISIPYEIFDNSSTDKSIICSYRFKDIKDIWYPATIINDLSAVTKDNYKGSILWDSKRDLGNIEKDLVFRVAFAKDVFGTTDTILIQVDNNSTPSVDITNSGSIQSKNPIFEVKIADTENDSVKPVVQFFDENSSEWKEATFSGVKTIIDADSYLSDTLSITWNSKVDLPVEFNDSVQIRIAVIDNDTSDFAFAKFHLINDDKTAIILNDTLQPKPIVELKCYPVPINVNDENGLTIIIPGGPVRKSLKIFDALGNIVDETIINNNGSVFTWDLKNKYGIKVSSGSYLVVCNTVDGHNKTTHTTVINVKE